MSQKLISPPTGLFVPALLRWGREQSADVKAFIDSGAAGNFIDQALVNRLGLPIQALLHPIPVAAADGRALGTGPIRAQTIPVIFQMGHHSERLSFFVTQAPELQMILGYPWLQQHNPQIDWETQSISVWSARCSESCLRSIRVPKEEPPHTIDLSAIPRDYWDLQEVFFKRRAQTLPPHREFDCAINLLPGTSPPRGRLFSLSGPEHKAMEDYITEALAMGFIRPSRSPAGAGFFFVKKKEGDLRTLH